MWIGGIPRTFLEWLHDSNDTYSCLSSPLFIIFQATSEIYKPGVEWPYSKQVGLSWPLLIEARKPEDDIKAPKFLCGDGEFPTRKGCWRHQDFLKFPRRLVWSQFENHCSGDLFLSVVWDFMLAEMSALKLGTILHPRTVDFTV